MKKRVIRIGVLAVVFVVALIVSSLLMNRGTDDQIIDMGAPTLPTVSFTVSGTEVNTLFGYVDDMDVTAMRDTITPLASDGTLQMQIRADGNEISSVGFQVYSLDGEEEYAKGDAGKADENGTLTMDLGGALAEDVQEAVLKVTLTFGGEEQKTVNYFTRIVRPDEITAAESLEFAQDFHTKALDQSASEELNAYLEPGEESDNTTYQTVNIHSDITHIQWGDLNPELIGSVRWSIKESNSVYTSIQAKYMVSCENDSGVSKEYNVKEFFRVRIAGDTVYLLDYNRDMQEVFDGGSGSLDENGILLGVASDAIPYEVNKDGTLIAFVQERDLWLYNKNTDEMYQVFSFADQEGQDERSRNDQHAVRIISMDNSGNLAFAVYGYMNRGEREGQVGVGIYYFDMERNVIEEKAFIPSTKSFAIAEDELGRMVYYNHGEEMLYVLAGGTLYQVDLESDEQTVLAEELEEGQYAVSGDGHLMAYQTNGTADTASEIIVMNLSSGEQQTIQAADGEAVRPLGFVNGDFIFGKIRPDDAGRTASGEETTPMYELEIRNSDNKTEASYSFVDDNIYITDILINENLVTLNRAAKNGEIYNTTSQEYITNNVERQETTVSLETYSTDRMERQVRFTFAEGTAGDTPRILKPNQLVSGEPLTIVLSGTSTGVKYYVYGMGELDGIFDRAGYAIQRAEQISGVVISSDQAYVWEKGNRDLAYSTEAEAFRVQSGETSLEACERYMEQYDAKRTDLSGCTLDQVLYVINKGCPVIALTDASHAILLTGYTTSSITYIDPETGNEETVSVSEMEDMTDGSGNTFIGYIR